MNYKILLLSILLIVLPSIVYAEENIKVECNNGEEYIECEVSAFSDYEVSALEYGFSLSSGINKIRFDVDESWQGNETDNLVLVYTDINKIGEFKIGTLYLENNSDINDEDIVLEKLIFYDSDFEEHIISSVKNEENNVEKDKNNNIIIICYVIISIGIIILIIYRIIKKGALK